MFYFFLFCINFLFFFFIYFLLRRKIDKALSLKEVENNLNELVVSFNRNAEINLRLFEDKKVAVEKLMKKVDEIVRRNQFLSSKENFFIERKKYEKTLLSQKKKTTVQDFLPMEKLETDKEKIFFLMKRRFSEQEIAKKLKLPLGEVKLVFAIEKNNNKKESECKTNKYLWM